MGAIGAALLLAAISTHGLLTANLTTSPALELEFKVRNSLVPGLALSAIVADPLAGQAGLFLTGKIEVTLGAF